MSDTVVDGSAVEIDDGGVELAPVEQTMGGELAVTPNVQAGELVERLATIREAMDKAMAKDIDYGVIPGTGKKPMLLKPGAEKLGVLFQLDVQIINEKVWGPGDHLTVMSEATAWHIPTGKRVGFGEGMCSTREKKYAKRRAELLCPNCGKANVRKSKNGDGFYCWAKTDGCGGNFASDDQRIVEQKPGDIDNPDLPDTWNTVVKMAEKRARVDVILAVTGASALFTQDVGDLPQSEAYHQAAAYAAAPVDPPDFSADEVLITKARAQLIIDGLWKLGYDDKAKLTLTSALGADAGDCSTKAKAVAAAGKLTEAQALKVEGWIERWADSQAAGEDVAEAAAAGAES